MRKFFKILAISALFSMPLASPVAAQDGQVKITNSVKIEQVSQSDSGEPQVKLVDPDVFIPGGRLIFVTDYQNDGAEPATNFVVTNPLHSAVRLADDADPDLTVSADGGTVWGKLSELTVSSEDGSTVAASHDDVTHIRWTLAEVAPGQSGRIKYPVIIR